MEDDENDDENDTTATIILLVHFSATMMITTLHANQVEIVKLIFYVRPPSMQKVLNLNPLKKHKKLLKWNDDEYDMIHDSVSHDDNEE